ncbi:MAG: tetratricopeptide repeat protein [Acidobacteriota bacterium]|nr:tetratricopeptide repeat protein [Acidobacteriota bacterium]
MSRLQTLILCFFTAVVSAFSQSSPDLNEEIQKLVSLVRNGTFDRAKIVASELVRDHPYVFDAHMASFRTNFEAFRAQPDSANSATHLESALKRLDFARRINPLNYEAWEFALSFWNPTRVYALPKNQQSEQALMEAENLLADGAEESAADALKRAISLDSSYAPAYTRLAEIYLRSGQYDEALEISHTATEKAPQDPTGFFMLARVFALLGRGEEAVDSLISSLQEDPSYPPTWQLMAQLDLGVEHMGQHFPKPVLWVIDQEIEEASDQDLVGIPEVTYPAWKAYITTKVRWRKFTFQRRNPQFKVYRYTFREELTALTDMLVIWKEIKAENPNKEDVLLDHWLAASQAGALDAAVFSDLFVEQFRQDFTVWKVENPKKFRDYFYNFVFPRAPKLNEPLEG